MVKTLQCLLFIVLFIIAPRLVAQQSRIQVQEETQPQQYTINPDPISPDPVRKNKTENKIVSGCPQCYTTKKSADSLIYADPNYQANKLIRESGKTDLQSNIDDKPIFPDLQVTATPEVPEHQIFSGTEIAPGTASFKSDTSISAERVAAPTEETQPPPSAKREFLKQYAESLKLQIEANKRNPDYPLAVKKKELADLEKLLKEE